MKLENFEAAVHLYGKAIELNPANAVYFCNRYGWGWRGVSMSDGVGCGLCMVSCVPVALREEQRSGVDSADALSSWLWLDAGCS